jgi:RHS repeat-associated protein
VANGATTEFVFNATGQRVSEWNGSTHAQLKGKYYWGSKPVAYYTAGTGAATHFEHQDWMGTERVRTTYNSANNPVYSVENTYTSQPFGDDQTPSSDGGDANHYAMLDHDAETDTDHAQFRQYHNAQGRWMSPDPYSGSYDFSNPQSFNRYSYAANLPVSNIDWSGLSVTSLGGGCYEDSGSWGTEAGGASSSGTWDTIFCMVDEDGGGGGGVDVGVGVDGGGGGGGGGGTQNTNQHTLCPPGTTANTSKTPDYTGGATEYGVKRDGSYTRFAFKPTASGPPFNPWGYTAASKITKGNQLIPMYAYVDVVSANNPSANVVVQITDNGPLGTDDIIDLSAAAMQQLTGKAFDSISVNIYTCRAVAP